jgi:hypothetical protein
MKQTTSFLRFPQLALFITLSAAAFLASRSSAQNLTQTNVKPSLKSPTKTTTVAPKKSGLLSDKELLPALEDAVKNMRAALEVKENQKNSTLEASQQYSNWQLQCLMLIENDEKSPLWKPCLAFNVYMFETDETGEAVTLLIPLIEKHSKKLAQVASTLSEKEQGLLKSAIDAAKAYRNQ